MDEGARLVGRAVALMGRQRCSTLRIIAIFSFVLI
jgi:hypothetical protein